MGRRSQYVWPPAISLDAARDRLRETGWTAVNPNVFINRHQQCTIDLSKWDSEHTFEITSPTQIEGSPSDMLEVALVNFDQVWPE